MCEIERERRHVFPTKLNCTDAIFYLCGGPVSFRLLYSRRLCGGSSVARQGYFSVIKKVSRLCGGPISLTTEYCWTNK